PLDDASHGRPPRDVLGPQHDRGRSSLAPPGQAAESAVRAELAETAIDALTTTVVASGSAAWRAQVQHTDGRTWTAAVRRGAATALRAPSCGRTPEPYTPYDVELAAGEVAS